MHNEEQKITRKKLVGWLGLLSLFTVTGLAWWPKKSKKKNSTVKMLTEDGRLVEIDATLLAANTKKASNKELQSWVKRK